MIKNQAYREAYGHLIELGKFLTSWNGIFVEAFWIWQLNDGFGKNVSIKT